MFQPLINWLQFWFLKPFDVVEKFPSGGEWRTRINGALFAKVVAGVGNKKTRERTTIEDVEEDDE
jgi:hypothetical protein